MKPNHFPAKSSRTRHWIILLALILLAAWLRLHNLGAASLRGDEAFAVRYWAQSPGDVLRTLAPFEPHPYGTFFGFWAWKSLVGGSEFAMRMLPTLINLLGVPAMYALTRRLLRSRSVAHVAALLWAINPHLIWHSQDARNYAIWAGLSVVALWLMIRASDQPSNRRNWALYIVATTLTLYVFFLEAFIVVVHGLYILRQRRQAARAWLASLLVIGVLLIPWFAQVWTLAHSGYSGTAHRAEFGLLGNQFVPTLLFGENLNGSWATSINWLLLLSLVVSRVVLMRVERTTALLLLLITPPILLFIAATRINVFLPRYLMAITPALLFPTAYVIVLAGQALKHKRPVAILLIGLIMPFALLTGDALANYYSPVYHKGADWRSLGTFLHENAATNDAIIVTSPDANGYIDPAFGYYYSGPLTVDILPYPRVDTVQTVDQLLASRGRVWLVPAGGDVASVTDALQASGTLIMTEHPGGFMVHQYRSKTVQAGEIETALNLNVASGQLSGYRIYGNSTAGSTMVVLLYWEQSPASGHKVFVHLLGPTKPDGSPVWAQNDHPPSAPGRDVYAISLAGVPAGKYTLVIGLYDAKTGTRSPIVDGATGQEIGDSFTLTEITVNVGSG